MSFKQSLHITHTIFSTFRLSYQSPLIAHLKIDNLEFASEEQLYTYLRTWINNELLQAIESFLLWRTEQLRHSSPSKEQLLAIQTLKNARQLLSDIDLDQRPQFVLDNFIQAMILLTSRQEKHTYPIAINKVEVLENYCFDLIQQQHILICNSLPQNNNISS